jgi:hypothetical protein
MSCGQELSLRCFYSNILLLKRADKKKEQTKHKGKEVKVE